MSHYIKAELNFKSLSFSAEEGEFIDLNAKANFPVLGKRLGKQMKHFANQIANLTPNDIDKLQRDGHLDIDEQRF